MANKAVFLDRDGTIMDDPGYLSDPAGVKLLPGVDLAVKSLRQAGYKIVVVTNQSGVARGLLSEDTLEKIHAELRRKLAEKGAMLDAIYYCPFHPEGSVPQYTQESELRKPAPGMLYQAAKELDLDLKASWMVGDALRDVAAGFAAGCRTVLLPSEKNDTEDSPDQNVTPDFTARNLVEAARTIMHANHSQPQSEPEEISGVEVPSGLFQADPPEDDIDDTPADLPAKPPAPLTVPSDPCDEDSDDMPTDTPSRVFTATEPSSLEDDSVIRKEILRHVRQMSRQGETEEFSMINLLGGVVQILVVLLLVVVFWQALGKQQYQQAMLWAVVAVVMQTMSMTFFLMARYKR